ADGTWAHRSRGPAKAPIREPSGASSPPESRLLAFGRQRRQAPEALALQLLLAPFANFPQSFVAFAISIALASLMVYIFLRAASTAEGRPSALRSAMRRPNAKIL